MMAYKEAEMKVKNTGGQQTRKNVVTRFHSEYECRVASSLGPSNHVTNHAPIDREVALDKKETQGTHNKRQKA
jgi:hypothetical protein